MFLGKFQNQKICIIIYIYIYDIYIYTRLIMERLKVTIDLPLLRYLLNTLRSLLNIHSGALRYGLEAGEAVGTILRRHFGTVRW